MIKSKNRGKQIFKEDIIMGKFGKLACTIVPGIFMAMGVSSAIIAVTVLIASKTEVNK